MACAAPIQLARSAYDKVECGSQHAALAAEPLQMRQCAVPQFLQPAAGPLDAEQRDHGRLAGGGIAPEVLARDIRIARYVQQVVLDLEREPEIRGIAEQRPARGLRAAAEKRAR